MFFALSINMACRFVNIIVIVSIAFAFAVVAWDDEFSTTKSYFHQPDDLQLLRERRQTKDVCNHELFKRLRSCCKLPSFFGNGTWRACRIKIRGSDNENPKTPEERFCVAQCVLQNRSLLNSDGTIDLGKLSTHISTSMNATWQTVLQTAMTNCSATIAPVVPQTTPSGGKTCNPRPAALVQCMRRYALLNCPSIMKLNNSATCSADLQKLSTCVVPALNIKINTTAG